MVNRWTVFTTTFLATLIIPTARGLAPIEALGSKLYDSETGDQFYIRAYRVFDDLDPLSVPAQCDLDAPLMKTLGVNTIRVYEVEYTRSHDACMSSFEQAGIYVIVGLSGGDAIIDGYDPEWTMDMFTHFTKTLDTFAKYDNLLAVTVGNEVIEEGETTTAAPYVKAAIRDTKAYRDGQGYRKIPVGYTSADDDATRLDIQNFLVCGDTIADNADFFGLNRFSWCGNSSFTDSGYSDLYDDAKDYPVPIFFSETGCDEVGEREFDDQEAVLGSEMNDRWSGAIMDTLTPTGTPSSLYTPAYTSVACPSTTISSWSVIPTAPLPTIENLVITTKPAASLGKDSSGTQKAAGPSSPTAVAVTKSKFGSSGLSTGAKAAIGVIVPVVVLGFAIMSFLLWRRRRSATTKPAPDEKGPEYSEVIQEQNSPREGVGEFYKPRESEIGGNPVSQLHGEGVMPELGSEMGFNMGDVGRELVELDAYSPPLELSNGPSVRRPSRDSRRDSRTSTGSQD
ncbi:MAG: hypothetical protein Q9170_003276 [Blastenia crenularia]